MSADHRRPLPHPDQAVVLLRCPGPLDQRRQADAIVLNAELECVPCFKRYLWGRIKGEFWAKQIAYRADIKIDTSRTFTEQLMDLSNQKLVPDTAAHISVLQAAVKWLEPRM